MSGGCDRAEAPQQPLDRAKSALAAGDGFGAELALREMLDAGTPKVEIAALMGEAELLQGQLVEARHWLGSGQFSPADAGRGFHILGRLEMREGNLPAAGQAFDRALQFAPESARLWVDIGRLRYRGGEQAMAVDAAVKAVALGPEEPDALLFRGQLARDSQGAHAALPWFERAMAAQPGHLDIQAEYAATLGEAGKATKMLEVLRAITERNPGYQRAYFLQAVLAARSGNFSLAERLLARAGSDVKASAAGSLLAGIVDLENGNFASAAQELDRLHRQQPENRRVRDLLARALATAGNHRELVHRFDKAARLESASPYFRTLVARSHEALGQRKEAASLLDLANRPQTGNLIALAPERDTATIMPGNPANALDALTSVRSLISSGNPAGAVQAANRFLASFPGSADALALAGDAQLASRNVGAALGYYRQSATIRQPWLLARKRFAALQAVGRKEEAIAILRNYLAGHPGAVEAAVVLARVEHDRGNLPASAALLDHALAAGAGSDPEILALRAVVAMRMRQRDVADSMARRAMALQPGHPASVQAMALVGNGRLKTALLAKLGKSGGTARIAMR
ncbi:tetratricopeptide repeat protein [Parerythrobacter aurantius]|uniref:tetratricopeptide repeat protein n=1 Tax=Parerythrobacter aurantius TaxID=3127706 RepID=UPI003246C723